MLRNIIQSGSKLIKNSRSLQCSSIFREKNKDEEKHGEENNKENKPDDYWNTELPTEDAISRACRVLGKQMRDIRNRIFFWKPPTRPDWAEWSIDSTGFPTHIDVLIIGGGLMGVSTAYWIKRMGGETWTVVVMDKEPFNKFRPMLLSTSHLRQQFGLVENIEMSYFAGEFFKNINTYLSIDGQPPVDINYRPHGNLFLANNEEDAEALTRSVKILRNAGARTALLTPELLKKRFPWINTDGILLGSLGLELEGSFDSIALWNAFKQKCMALGVEFITADCKGFVLKKEDNEIISSPSPFDLYKRLNHAVVKTTEGEKKVIQFAICVIAAGAESGDIAKLMRIGNAPGMRSVPLPIEKRKRFLYAFEAPDGPGLNMPMIMDPTGTYFKRETLNNQFTTSRILMDDDEESFDLNPEPNNDFFYNKILPTIVHRVPSMKNINLLGSWAGIYDYNTFDGNGIVGPHPFYSNVAFATGFGESAAQMAPAVGRGLCEYIKNGHYRTVEMSRLNFDRFMTQESMCAAVI